MRRNSMLGVAALSLAVAVFNLTAFVVNDTGAHRVRTTPATSTTVTTEAVVPPWVPENMPVVTPDTAVDVGEALTVVAAERTTTTRASRSERRQTDYGYGAPNTSISTAPAPVKPQTDDFWRRLANCEDHDGEGVGLDGNHGGYFQFSSDTLRKLGISNRAPYERQREAAIEWARRIHPREGTTSGWPHCWWEALRG